MALLETSVIIEIHRVAIEAGFAARRLALLSGIAPAYVAALGRDDTAAGQILIDLMQMNKDCAIAGDTVPLYEWLMVASSLSDSFPSRQQFFTDHAKNALQSARICAENSESIMYYHARLIDCTEIIVWPFEDKPDSLRNYDLRLVDVPVPLALVMSISKALSTSVEREMAILQANEWLRDAGPIEPGVIPAIEKGLLSESHGGAIPAWIELTSHAQRQGARVLMALLAAVPFSTTKSFLKYITTLETKYRRTT